MSHNVHKGWKFTHKVVVKAVGLLAEEMVSFHKWSNLNAVFYCEACYVAG